MSRSVLLREVNDARQLTGRGKSVAIHYLSTETRLVRIAALVIIEV
jgi:hypothetical protein